MKEINFEFSSGLVVDDLHVKVGDKHILKGINLKINNKETHIIFGPNGSGKSTLLKVIMGIGDYKIIKGNIYFNGVEITDLSPDKRARLGIGLSFQKPPSIKGVKLKTLLALLNKKHDTILSEATELFKFEDHLERDVNLGFSGGELKKSEILQLIVQNPELIMLDEPESGVDLENLKLIGKTISELLGNSNKNNNRKMGLIITHTGYILEFINADKAHILLDGKLICEGIPADVFANIEKHGFKECKLCKYFT